MFDNFKWLVEAAFYSVIRARMNRKKNNVLNEYSMGWKDYEKYLDTCNSLDSWLRIDGMENLPTFCQVSGKLKYQNYDSGDFNKRKILEALQREFPNVKSVTEYGCGIGRNLLFLKQQMPHVEFYGYELCKPGVDLARAAAEKFGLDVSYSQLDYVTGEDDDYIFPKTDVSFTMYSLEQLPDTNKLAVLNILEHTNHGSIHIEPVPENYPFTLRGIIGRIDHWKANYLKNFELNVLSISNIEIKRESLDSSHNPLMFPTLYTLKKT